MNGNVQNSGRNGHTQKKKIPFSQKAARTVLKLIGGDSASSQSTQGQRRTRPAPPTPPQGKPQRNRQQQTRNFSTNAPHTASQQQRGGGAQSRQRTDSEQYRPPVQTGIARQMQRQGNTAPQQRQPQQRQPQQRQPQQRQPQQRSPQQRPPQRRPSQPMTPEQRRQYAERVARQKRIQHKKKIIKIFAASLSFAVVLLILSLTVFFKIDSIAVTPTEEVVYSNEEISKVCGIEYGTVNLFRCDIAAVEKKIEQGLPYIGNATVKRHFPSSLSVSVTPTYASAAIEYGTSYVLIDRDGKILEMTANTPKTIVILRCASDFSVQEGTYLKFETAAGEKDNLALYKELLAAIEKAELQDITLIDIRDVTEIKLMYQNRLTLYLGTDSMLDQKLSTAVKTLKYEDDGSKTKTGTINLSQVGVAYVSDSTDAVNGEGVTAAEEESTSEVSEG